MVFRPRTQMKENFAFGLLYMEINLLHQL